MENITIREGVQSDIPEVLQLIKELAEFERAADQVEVSEEQLIADGFGELPAYRFLVACSDKTVVGLSLFYYRYSTWKGKGLYLEDLIVTKPFRGLGIGKALLLDTAKQARKDDCTALYWQVLDWNAPAIEFYKTLGAQFDGEWVNCKLDKKSLKNII